MAEGTIQSEYFGENLSVNDYLAKLKSSPVKAVGIGEPEEFNPLCGQLDAREQLCSDMFHSTL